MLRACTLDFSGRWDDHLPLVEFVHNNSYEAMIGMPLYESLYGRKYRSSLHWDEVGERLLVGPDLVHRVVEKVQVI